VAALDHTAGSSALPESASAVGWSKAGRASAFSQLRRKRGHLGCDETAVCDPHVWQVEGFHSIEGRDHCSQPACRKDLAVQNHQVLLRVFRVVGLSGNRQPGWLQYLTL
jgi:hypothetical protein